jgi:hypothetical protein
MILNETSDIRTQNLFVKNKTKRKKVSLIKTQDGLEGAPGAVFVTSMQNSSTRESHTVTEVSRGKHNKQIDSKYNGE